MAQQHDWERLLSESAHTVSELQGQDGSGYAHVQRSPQQLTQVLKQLRPEHASERERLDATRVLAQSGVDERSLSRDASSVHTRLRPSLEDVFATDAPLADALESLHESLVASAVAQVHSDADDLFQSRVLQSLEADWRMHATAAARSASLSAASHSALPMPSDSFASSTVASLPQPLQAYVSAVASMNDALEQNATVDAVSSFQSAFEQTPSTSFAFQLIGKMAEEKSKRYDGASSQPLSAVLGTGSIRTLEEQYRSYLQGMCKRNPTVARVGGSTHGGLSMVHGAMRVSDQSNQRLDIDVAGGVPSVWRQTYNCLRAGLPDDAISALQSYGRTQQVSSVVHVIQATWKQSGEQLQGETMNDLKRQCDRACKDPKEIEREDGKYEAAVCALLCGDYHAVAEVIQTQHAIQSIEDFIWFLLNTCEIFTQGSPPSNKHTLEEIHRTLAQWPEDHYTQNGRAPEVYLSILLLTLQFSAAISFAREYGRHDQLRYVAPHLAAHLVYSNLLGPELEEFETGSSVKANVEKVLVEQAKELFHSRPKEALEYVNTIAKADELANNTSFVDAKVRHFGEAIVNLYSHVHKVLGPGESDCAGALTKFIHDDEVRRQAVKRAGEQCMRLRHREAAAAFMRRAGEYGEALKVTMEQLSQLGILQKDERKQVITAGDTIMQRAQSGRTGQDEQVQEIVAQYNNLKAALALLEYHQRGQYSMAVETLQQLDFLPTQISQARILAEKVKNVHWTLRERLADLIVAAAESLSDRAKYDRSGTCKHQFHALASFVSSCSVGLPTGLTNKLVALEPA